MAGGFNEYERRSTNTMQGDDKWKVKLDVDGKLHRVINLEPGELVVLDLNVPAVVNKDGRATISFKKCKGDFILVRRILWFEYEREGKITTEFLEGGGPQGKDAGRITPYALRLEVYPNPFQSKLRIAYIVNRNAKNNVGQGFPPEPMVLIPRLSLGTRDAEPEVSPASSKPRIKFGAGSEGLPYITMRPVD